MSELKIAIPETHSPSLTANIQRWAKENSVPEVFTGPTTQKGIRSWGLPWFRAGALVVNSEGKILMIHEGRVQVKKIKDEALKNQLLSEGLKPNAWVDGDGGWNIPAGRLNPGETFEYAAWREILEESGWNVYINKHLCTRHSEKPGNQYIMPVFLTIPVFGPAEFHTDETRETLEIAWLTPEEIRSMNAAGLLRSPESVMASLDAYEKII